MAYQGPLLPGQNASYFYKTGVGMGGGSPMSSAVNPYAANYQPQGGTINKPAGSVLAPSTEQSSGGGGSSGGGQPATGQPPMESAPSQPEINWDEIYQPAFDAINQAEAAQQSSYQQGLGEVQSNYDKNTADLANEQTTRLADYGQQRTGETKRTEGAISEARRMAAQLLQGLQSQYGGSTGTGAFRGEQLGAAASQNISGNREALQTALAGISQSENALKDKVIALQNEEDRNLQQGKLQLKAELDKALAGISATKGQLAVDKGARRADALSQYKQMLAEVEARNTQFKQQLYVQAQQQAQKLGELKMSAQDKYSANLKTANLQNGQQFNVGNTQYQVAPTASGDIQYLQGSLKTGADDWMTFPGSGA